MPAANLGGDALHCSFCAKSQSTVRKLIAGPAVYICNECVILCVELLEDEGHIERRWTVSDLLAQLDEYETAGRRSSISTAELRTYTDAATRFVRWMNTKKHYRSSDDRAPE